MKKLVLTLILSIVLGGTTFAQWYESGEDYNPNGYDTYFNQAYEFNPGQFEDNGYPNAYLRCNDAFITIDDRWDDYEIGAFVGEELRGFCFMASTMCPDGYLPMFEGIFVYFNQSNEEISFKVYDHGTGVEYDCTTNFTIVTGDDSNYYGTYDDPDGSSDETLIISFTAGETFTKEIVGYTGAADHYYLIASPVGNILASNVENLTANNYDFYSFNQSMPAEEWNNLKANTGYEMQMGQGYLYANSQDVTLSFTGTPLDPEEVGEYPVELDYDAECTTVWKGYNLIGNPYAEPAFLDREYLRLVDGEYVVVENYNEEAVDMIEGVFVQAEEEDEVATFSLGLAGPGFGEKKCVLNVTQGRGFVDRAVIHFGEGHQMTKVQFNSNHSKLYIPQDGEDYAVVRSAEMGEMPVNFKAGENGNYMLSVNPKNVEFNYLHLIDNLTGADVDLLVNPSYSFEANTTDYASRFKLVFATGANDENFAFFSNGSFVISNEGEATLQVIDVNGRILNNETISGSANVHVNAAPGVYMLRLINGNNVKVQKVIVK